MAKDKICLVEGCGGEVLCLGYCNRHYTQMRVKGRIVPDKKKPRRKKRLKGRIPPQRKGAIDFDTLGEDLPESERAHGANYYKELMIAQGREDEVKGLEATFILARKRLEKTYGIVKKK